MLGRRLASLLALVAWTSACRSRGSAETASAELAGVQVARCAAVARGPVCQLGAERALSTFVPAGWEDVDVAFDGQVVVHLPGTGDGGRRLDVVAPPGVQRLVVSAARRGERASFSLRVTDRPPAPAWLESARKLKERGALDEASRTLDDGERATDGSDDGHGADVASLRARILLARGQGEPAGALLASAAEQHVARGEVSQAADDLGARAYLLVTELRRGPEARATIARLATFADEYPEAGALSSYYAGLLARETDPAGGLELLQQARLKADRLGVDKITRSIAQLDALTLLSLGRAVEAHARLVELEAQQGSHMSPCERGTLVGNIGWAAYLARESPAAARGTAPDPLPALEDAVATFSGACADSRQQAVALVNLARGRLQLRDARTARETLARARAALAHPRALLAFAELDTEGRIALAEGDARGALRAFDALAAAASGVSRLDEESAEEGRAMARRGLGDRAGAIAAATRADGLLDESARAIPAGEGRGAFWWTRARLAEMQLSLLLEDGRPGDALDAARRQRARIVRDVQRSARAESLPPASRDRWEAALGEYRHARDAIVAEASDDWSLSAEALARRLAERRRRDVTARALLDQAAQELFPRAASELRPLSSGDGVVGLAMVPLGDGWALFVVQGDKIRVSQIAAPTDPAHADVAAAALLAAAGDALELARRIRVLPFGSVRDVDLAAIEVAGKPLVLRAPIEYPLDAGDAGLVDTALHGPRLVVADPSGTLPSAREEGVAVAAQLDGDGGVRILLGAEATRSRVLEELPRASSLHFAGHASYAGIDGWESALLLAGDERLTVADVLAMPHAPRRVVLSGCETASEAERGGGPAGLGLAEAFIAAGSREVIGATRRVDDAATRQLMRALSTALARTPDAAQALQSAELEVRGALATTDWSAFRTFVP